MTLRRVVFEGGGAAFNSPPARFCSEERGLARLAVCRPSGKPEQQSIHPFEGKVPDREKGTRKLKKMFPFSSSAVGRGCRLIVRHQY